MSEEKERKMSGIKKVHAALLAIQSTLKAPKSQVNNFGGYRYRSCEDILEALKPHLLEQKAIITVSDNIVHVVDRFYVQATATITSTVDGSELCVSALARESFGRKGMDDSQLTGSTSSYARKYALSGLLLIDDTKDADATNERGDENKKYYSEEDFHKNFPAWEKAIKSGQRSATDLISMVESKAPLTDEQIKKIKASADEELSK